MRIKFYATLRAAAEGKALDLDVSSPITIREALKAATQLKPKLAPALWDEQGNLRDIIRVFLNGRQSEFLPEGLETLVSDKDELDVFPPVGGGA